MLSLGRHLSRVESEIKVLRGDLENFLSGIQNLSAQAQNVQETIQHLTNIVQTTRDIQSTLVESTLVLGYASISESGSDHADENGSDQVEGAPETLGCDQTHPLSGDGQTQTEGPTTRTEPTSQEILTAMLEGVSEHDRELMRYWRAPFC